MGKSVHGHAALLDDRPQTRSSSATTASKDLGHYFRATRRGGISAAVDDKLKADRVAPPPVTPAKTRKAPERQPQASVSRPQTRASLGPATPAKAAAGSAKGAAKARAAKQTPKARTRPQVCRGAAKKKQRVPAQQQQAKQPRNLPLKRVEIDEDTSVGVGDDVYVLLSGELDVQELQEGEACALCGEEGDPEEAMLECDRCLQGFHLGCLQPPLEVIPEGDWLCSGCAAGSAPPRQAKRCRTMREELLTARDRLALGRIERAWQAGASGEQWALVRWYEVPERTHTGRKAHHAAREVFLTESRDPVEACSLLRAAQVCSPATFAEAAGDDVFLCEYEYSIANQAFRRRTDGDGAGSGSDWAASGDEASDGEGEAQREYRPVYELWADKGLVPRRDARGGSAGVRRARQGGDDWRLAQRPLRPGSTPAGPAAPQTPLQQGRAQLALTAQPRSMPGRERERGQIAGFVEEAIAAGQEAGRCLYVSGVPGTGKTATVRDIVRDFKQRAREKKAPEFTFVELNSLRLASPKHAYTFLYEALTGCHAGPAAAAACLETMFSSGGGAGRRATVLLVDEMDLLVTRKQTVLYNLFEWPTRKGSRLAVIGIANTMDLPERLLPRIASRLAGRRVVFQPYNRQQLEAIARSRLAGLQCFEPRAIEYAARKVSSVSGDVRRCLELLRRAAEIVEERQHKQHSAVGQASCAGSTVQMSHVDAAMAGMFQATHMQLMRGACRLDKLLLAALLLETRASGHAESTLEAVSGRLQALCLAHSEAPVNLGQAAAAASRLGAKRVILADPGVKRLRMHMSLNVPTDDLVHVLKGDESIDWLKHLNI